MIEFVQKLLLGTHRSAFSENEFTLLNTRLFQECTHQKAGVFRFEKKYVGGTLDVAKNGTGFLQVAGMRKDFIVEKDALNGARRGDIVVAKRTRGTGRAKAIVLHILTQKDTFILVYTKKVGGRIEGVELKSGLPIGITSSQKSLKQLPLRTVLKIGRDSLDVMEVFGLLDDPLVDEKISLALFDKKEMFSARAEVEASAYGNRVDKSMYPMRKDLTHLPFCTIDPPTAKDFDDAIYYDRFAHTLYVAIADVSEYVNSFTDLDNEAKQRGFTIYFPHKSIPMLPRSLSENICSLKPKVDRLAHVVKIVLDKQTDDVVYEEFFEAIIHSRRRYTYDEIDAYLEGDMRDHLESEQELLDFLLPLNALTERLRQKRYEVGFHFRSHDSRLALNENQELLSVEVEHETPSHALIEDCMLLANKAAAKVYNFGVFRVHPAPSPERIMTLTNDVRMLGINVDYDKDIHKVITHIQAQADELDLSEEVDMMIIKAQKRAEYMPKDGGHFGLGFEHYTHFTSPIRRYSDLIVHRLIKTYTSENKSSREYLLQNIETTCHKISNLERESDKVAWDYQDRKFARYAKARLRQSFKAEIVSDENLVVAEFEEELPGARVVLPWAKGVSLYEKVMVQIIEVDLAEPKITGKLVHV